MSILHPIKERPDGRKVRYGVVGAGWIAQEDFMPGVARSGNSELTALITGDPEKARELVEQYGLQHINDYDGFPALVDSGYVEALYIAVPNQEHCALAVRALKAGVHVLCEKPMATTEEECIAMIEAAKQGNAKLMVVYRLHFEEATVEALEIARSGKLGELRFFSSAFAQQVKAGNHRTQGSNWAGPLPDMGPYPINAVRQLFAAEPTEVLAVKASGSDPRFKEVPEMVSVTLRFPGERLAQFTVSYGASPFGQYRIAGTEGDLEVTPGYTWTAKISHRLTIGEKTTEKSFAKVDQFAGETKYFSDCILDGIDPEPNGEEGLADVRVLLAIEKSLQSGKAEPIAPLERTRRPTRDQVQKIAPGKAPELVHAEPAS